MSSNNDIQLCTELNNELIQNLKYSLIHILEIKNNRIAISNNQIVITFKTAEEVLKDYNDNGYTTNYIKKALAYMKNKNEEIQKEIK